MTGKRAIHQKIRALAGSALVGPGLFVLFGHLVCAAAQFTDLLRSTSGLGVLSSIILAASSDRHWLLQIALRIVWPTLLVALGAILFGDDSDDLGPNSGGCPQPGCAGA